MSDLIPDVKDWPVWALQVARSPAKELAWLGKRGYQYLGFEGSGLKSFKDDRNFKLSEFDVILNRPFYIEAPAVWDGEGLPPVSTVCEYSLTNGGVWHQCTIKYVLANGKQLVADCAGNPDGEAVLHVNTCQFRTPRTPEQIKAEERVDAIAEMRAVVIAAANRRQATVVECLATVALYDAGYRKQVAP